MRNLWWKVTAVISYFFHILTNKRVVPKRVWFTKLKLLIGSQLVIVERSIESVVMPVWNWCWWPFRNLQSCLHNYTNLFLPFKLFGPSKQLWNSVGGLSLLLKLTLNTHCLIRAAFWFILDKFYLLKVCKLSLETSRLLQIAP